MRTRARSVLPGKVVAIVRGPVSTEVTLGIAPGIQLNSSITTHLADAPRLKERGKADGGDQGLVHDGRLGRLTHFIRSSDRVVGKRLRPCANQPMRSVWRTSSAGT